MLFFNILTIFSQQKLLNFQISFPSSCIFFISIPLKIGTPRNEINKTNDKKNTKIDYLFNFFI